MNMKSFLAFALLFVHAIRATPTGGESQEVHGPFRAFRKAASSLAPASRSLGSNNSPAAVECVGKCATKMSADMKRELPDFNPDSPDPANFNPAKLDKMCQIHDTGKSCVEACPSSGMKTMFQKALGIMQFICHDSTFKQNAQCLSDVAKNNTATCEADSKCGLHKKKVEQYKVTPPTNEAGLKDYLKSICTLQKCMLDCGKPAVVQKCGQAAQNDLKGLAVKSTEFLKYVMESMGLANVYPQECNQVAAD